MKNYCASAYITSAVWRRRTTRACILVSAHLFWGRATIAARAVAAWSQQPHNRKSSTKASEKRGRRKLQSSSLSQPHPSATTSQTVVPDVSSRYFATERIFDPLPRIADKQGDSENDAMDSLLKETNFDPWTAAYTVVPQLQRPLPVLYTNHPKYVAQWLADHVPSGGCVLGFDVESLAAWRPSSLTGPATVQLATPDAAIVIHLFRLSGKRSSACLPWVESVLRDERIVLAGCGLTDDMLDLQHYFGGNQYNHNEHSRSFMESTSRLELSRLGTSQKGQTGLKTLTASLLGVELQKTKKLATADWSKIPLPDKQIAYAARDAWAAAAIVERLRQYDPDTFEHEALVQRLRSETAMEDLVRREVVRRQTKLLIGDLEAPFADVQNGAPIKRIPSTMTPPPTAEEVARREMSAWRRHMIAKLKTVVREHARMQDCVFLDGYNINFAQGAPSDL